MEAYCDHKWSLVHHNHSQSTAPCLFVLQTLTSSTAESWWDFLVCLKMSYCLSKMISASWGKSQSLPEKKNTPPTNTTHHLAPGQHSPPTAYLRLAPPDCHPPPTVHTQAPSQQIDCQTWNTAVFCPSPGSLLQLLPSACFCSVWAFVIQYIDLWRTTD